MKRPKSLGNVTDNNSPPDAQWSEIPFPLSGGWSPPVFIRTKDPHEEQRKQFEKDCRYVPFLSTLNKAILGGLINNNFQMLYITSVKHRRRQSQEYFHVENS